MSETRFPVTGRVLIGLVVITLGILFTLDNFNVMDAGEVLRAWPVLPIAYGLMRLTGFGTRKNAAAGMLITGFGVLLLAHNYGAIVTDPWNLWPVALILIGASMVMGSISRARAGGGNSEGSSSLNSFALMSGTERKIGSQEFRGGDITAIMGGHVIDLRSAKTAPGGAVLDLLVWWGGVDLKVPADWEVANEALPIMGAVEDNSKPPTGPVAGRLTLRGLIVMGGVEVKN